MAWKNSFFVAPITYNDLTDRIWIIYVYLIVSFFLVGWSCFTLVGDTLVAASHHCGQRQSYFASICRCCFIVIPGIFAGTHEHISNNCFFMTAIGLFVEHQQKKIWFAGFVRRFGNYFLFIQCMSVCAYILRRILFSCKFLFKLRIFHSVDGFSK